MTEAALIKRFRFNKNISGFPKEGPIFGEHLLTANFVQMFNSIPEASLVPFILAKNQWHS